MPLQRLPVLIVIDCEPDARRTRRGDPAPWLGFERLFEWLAALRPALADLTGAPARFCWFWRLDPQIAETYGAADWPIAAHRAQLAQMERQGDEIGLHVHAWRWDAGDWLIDHADQGWIDHCVRSSVSCYEAAFGRRCRSFRFGDGWINDATLDLIESLGIRYDLTIEPGRLATPGLVAAERSTGYIPDRRGAPIHPYRRASGDFRRAGDSALWIVPLTTVPPLDRWRGWVLGEPLSTLPLSLVTSPPHFAAALDVVLRQGRAHLTLVARTDAGLNTAWEASIRHNLETLAAHPWARHPVFVTPHEALAAEATAMAGAKGADRGVTTAAAASPPV